MNICCISREFPWRQPYGGVGVYVRDISRAMVAAGHHVTVVTESPTDVRMEENVSGVRVIGVPLPRIGWLPPRLAGLSSVTAWSWARTAAAAMHELPAPHPDIIEVPETNGEAACLPDNWRGAPVVLRIHGSCSGQLKVRGLYRWFHYPLFRLERRPLVRARFLTAASGAALRDAEALFGLRLSHGIIIPALVDTTRFTPAAAPTRNGPPEVLFVGRLNAVKGFDLMPEIIRAVHAEKPEVGFVFAGADLVVSSETMERSEAFLRSRLSAESNARITFLGCVPHEELPDVYRRASVLVAPSRVEAFSIVCAEASSSALPVIGAAGTGMADIVENGRTGFLGNVEQPECFARRILELVRDPEGASRLGQAGRVRTERLFSLDTVTKATLQFYSKCLASGPQHRGHGSTESRPPVRGP